MIGISLNRPELEAVMKRLGALGPAVELRVVGQASRKAMKPMLADAKRRCPHPTIRKTLTIRQRKYRRSGNTWTGIGPEKGASWSGVEHLTIDGMVGILEFGAKAHPIPAPTGGLKIGPIVIHGTVQHPGLQPHPFIRPAFDAHARSAVGILERELSAGVEREVKKLAHSGGGSGLGEAVGAAVIGAAGAAVGVAAALPRAPSTNPRRGQFKKGGGRW